MFKKTFPLVTEDKEKRKGSENGEGSKGHAICICEKYYERMERKCMAFQTLQPIINTCLIIEWKKNISEANVISKLTLITMKFIQKQAILPSSPKVKIHHLEIAY